MNEGIKKSPSPEEIKRLQDKEDAEELAGHFALYPEQIIILSSRKNLIEVRPEIAEFEAMIVSFESTHSIEKLCAIVDISLELSTVFKFAIEISYTPEQLEHSLRDVTKREPEYAKKQREKITAAKAIVLTPEDREKFEMRLAAQKDIIPIIKKLDIFKKETNIHPEKYKELENKCNNLMRAIGRIDNSRYPNKIIHSIIPA